MAAMKTRFFRMAFVLALLAGVAACVVTEPSPYAQGLLQPGFNKAWNNAVDAMKEEGLQIAMADVAGGRLDGRRGQTLVRARLTTQGVGNIRAEFESTDAALADRVEERYKARMAR
jgi:hypothetical protein